MSEPIPKFLPLSFRPRPYWNVDPSPPARLEEDEKLTARDLVDFGGEEPVRLPAGLLHVLAELRRTRISVGKAKAVLGEEGAQKSIELSIRIHPRMLASPADQDDLYEQIEGAATTKFVVHAKLLEQNVPRYRTIVFDDDDFVELDNLPVDMQPDDEEAWLLVSTQDLFWQNVEQTELALEQWQAEHDIKGLAGFQVLEDSSDDRTPAPSGIELPGLPTRSQVQDLIEKLTSALDVDISVALTQKDYVTETRHGYSSLFEDARSMARRLRSGR